MSRVRGAGLRFNLPRKGVFSARTVARPCAGAGAALGGARTDRAQTRRRRGPSHSAAWRHGNHSLSGEERTFLGDAQQPLDSTSFVGWIMTHSSSSPVPSDPTSFIARTTASSSAPHRANVSLSPVSPNTAVALRPPTRPRQRSMRWTLAAYLRSRGKNDDLISS